MEIEWEPIKPKPLSNFTEFIIKASIQSIRNRIEQENRGVISEVYEIQYFRRPT